MVTIRCSKLNDIMTFPRSKKDELSKTALAYIKERILVEKGYIKEPDFSSKYTEKGNIVEVDSKNLAAKVLGYGVLLKNEEHFKQDILTGTPDIILPDEIIDIKSSWNARTFPFFDDYRLPKNYYWQGVGYCILTNKNRFKIVYCLVNTPEHLVEQSVWQKVRELGVSYDDLYDKIKSEHTFDHIPENDRVRVFEVEVTDEIKEQVITQLEVVKKYYKKLVW